MDTARLLLCAALILAPPAAYTVGIIIYNHRRRARLQRGRPTIADITARITAEKANQEHRDEHTDQGAEPEPAGLPPGWHWPGRDQDRL
ncbi:hypothetical protein [Amycolatopsis sp. NPDC004378]